MKHYIGVDIGGMSIKAGIVKQDGNLIAKQSCKTRVGQDYRVIIKDIFSLCQELLRENSFSKRAIYGIGVGCPGTIWSSAGMITFANNLYFNKVPFVQEFKKHWDIKTVIDNDANCAALGEYYFGSGQESKNCICITLGTGVGTGIIIDGNIFRGERGSGAEAGHMVIKVDSEERCSCGRKGCWEVYASASGLIRDTKKAIKNYPNSIMKKIMQERNKVSGRTAFDAADQGDKVAQQLVNQYIEYIGVGVVNLVNIFRPDTILIGGGISNQGQELIDSIQDYVDRYHYGGTINPRAKIKKASLLNDAGIIGAATLVMDADRTNRRRE